MSQMHLTMSPKSEYWCCQCEENVDQNDKRPFIVMMDGRIVCLECFREHLRPYLIEILMAK